MAILPILIMSISGLYSAAEREVARRESVPAPFRQLIQGSYEDISLSEGPSEVTLRWRTVKRGGSISWEVRYASAGVNGVDLEARRWYPAHIKHECTVVAIYHADPAPKLPALIQHSALMKGLFRKIDSLDVNESDQTRVEVVGSGQGLDQFYLMLIGQAESITSLWFVVLGQNADEPGKECASIETVDGEPYCYFHEPPEPVPLALNPGFDSPEDCVRVAKKFVRIGTDLVPSVKKRGASTGPSTRP